MRRRWLILAIALFQALWLNVIVPGHLRGIVQLPNAAGAAVPACCCGEGGVPSPSKKTPTPAQRAKNCAICFFCAHVSSPPVVAFDLAPLGVLCGVRPDTSDDLFARAVLLPFDCCGPPTVG